MSTPSWQISGDYFETCNCDYLCPCLPGNAATVPTKGHCAAAMAYHIDQGRYGDVALDGLNFVVVLRTPGVMGEGNWSVGLLVDERATQEQQEALTAITSGQAGGPMAAFAPLISNFLGVESKPIRYVQNGMSRSISVEGLLEQGCEGVPSPINPEQPLYMDNTIHPANPRLALAKSTGSHLHAFGIDWDDTSGNNNGHFAPFNWQGA